MTSVVLWGSLRGLQFGSPEDRAQQRRETFLAGKWRILEVILAEFKRGLASAGELSLAVRG